MRFLISVTLLALSLAWSKANANPRDVQWHQMESEHFRVIFDVRQSDLAKEYLSAAEWARSKLASVFSEGQSDFITIVISDGTDLANGLATFLPYQMIIVNPVLPNALDSIGQYEDWPKDLIAHELGHIYSFVPSNGIYTPLRYIFGSVVHPTGILPRWYLEGLAVELETRLTTHGRLRAPGSWATVRALVQEGLLEGEGIDRVNETSIPTYPWGGRPYLFGSMIWRELTFKKGATSIDTLLARYGRRLPFLLNEPLRDLTGQTWPEFWRDVTKTYSIRARAQIEKIKAAGYKQTQPLDTNDGWQHSPAVSPDGQTMAYIAGTFWGGGEIRLLSKAPGQNWTEGEIKTVVRGSGILRVNWRSDGVGFVFEQIGAVERFRQHRDLYFYDAQTGQTERLTHSERAQEAAFSPAGRDLVYVRLDGGNSSLWLRNEQGISRQIYSPKFGHRLSRPEFLNATEIVFAERDRRGREVFFKLPVEGGKAERFLPDMHLVGMPSRTKDGLVFTSAKSGVSNLYLTRQPFSNAVAITNSTTEVVNGTIDEARHEIIFSELTADGRKIFLSKDLSPLRPPATPPLADLSDLSPTPEKKKVNPESQIASEGHVALRRGEVEYEPWRYLYPRYWIPFVFPVEGGVIFQSSIQAMDPLARHIIDVGLSYDTVSTKLSSTVGYTNRVTYGDWMAFYLDRQDLLSSGSSPVFLRQRAGQVGGSFFLPSLSNSWTGLLMAQYQSSEIPSSSGILAIERAGPTVGLAYNNMAANGFMSEFDLNRAWSLRHTEFIPDGNLIGYGRTQAAGSLAWRGPLPIRHRLRAQASVTYSPQILDSQLILLGERTLGANYFLTLINSSNLMRGYSSGAFVGREMYLTNLGYDFPLKDIFEGAGTFPAFVRNLTMGVFLDAMSLNGAFYNRDILAYQRVQPGRIFLGSGLDFSLNTTIAYHLPMSFQFGLYYGFDRQAGGDLIPFVGIGLNGLQGLNSNNQNQDILNPHPRGLRPANPRIDSDHEHAPGCSHGHFNRAAL